MHDEAAMAPARGHDGVLGVVVHGVEEVGLRELRPARDSNSALYPVRAAPVVLGRVGPREPEGVGGSVWIPQREPRSSLMSRFHHTSVPSSLSSRTLSSCSPTVRTDTRSYSRVTLRLTVASGELGHVDRGEPDHQTHELSDRDEDPADPPKRCQPTKHENGCQ